ncbi:beta-L-arabinofuranosidase domain-containing protein [Microbacterium radiodurans]|uniref:beta-L-arabinofuranosidase domain-containing protein n=1 Tax=Microbacterium radiodurans TaxID=661398 RepID=UPI00168BBBA3|nr:beta-L-arabinofuranosidase domain-containing protein [Microbacterium radiodurans]
MADPLLVTLRERSRAYLLSLEPERFLHPWLRHAGLPPSTKPGYGGWERETDARFTGHFFGHYLSAAARASVTAPADERRRLEGSLAVAVDGLARAQAAYAVVDPRNAGYVAPFSVTSLPAGADGLLVPFYDLHKVLAGLLDVHRYAPATTAGIALEVAGGFGSWLADWADRFADDAALLATEYGGMNDALYRLYEITGDVSHRRAAEHFDELDLFAALAAGDDPLPGRHANTTIPKLIGALARARVLSDPALASIETVAARERTAMSRRAAERFFDLVLRHYTYANGGNSAAEHFREPGTLRSWATSGSVVGYGENSTAEGCNVYNMRKLARGLFEATGDARFAHYDDHALRNSIVASASPETGMVTYFQPMTSGYAKVFGAPQDEFWCDHGTGIESLAGLGDAIAFADDDGLVLTQFWAARIAVPERGLVVSVQSDLPSSDVVEIAVDAAADEAAGTGQSGRSPASGNRDRAMVLRLRVPDWVGAGVGLERNGEPAAAEAADGFLAVRVSAGDRLSYRLPARVRVVPAPGDDHWVAFAYGPALLAARFGAADPDDTYRAGVLVRMGLPDRDAPRTITVADPDAWLADPGSSVVPAPEHGPLRFRLRGVDERAAALVFEPYATLDDARYGIAFAVEPVAAAAGAGADTEAGAASAADADRTGTGVGDSDVTDRVLGFDDSNAEAEKRYLRSRSRTGEEAGRRFRDAAPGGWFSYDLAVGTAPGDRVLELETGSGLDAGGLEVRAADTVIAAEGFDDAPDAANAWRVLRFRLPAPLVAASAIDREGQRAVRIRIASVGDQPVRVAAVVMRTDRRE